MVKLVSPITWVSGKDIYIYVYVSIYLSTVNDVNGDYKPTNIAVDR